MLDGEVNSDLKTTLIYSHLSQDHKKRAVNLLGQKISPTHPSLQEKSSLVDENELPALSAPSLDILL
jgi:hypothetical protein